MINVLELNWAELHSHSQGQPYPYKEVQGNWVWSLFTPIGTCVQSAVFVFPCLDAAFICEADLYLPQGHTFSNWRLETKMKSLTEEVSQSNRYHWSHFSSPQWLVEAATWSRCKPACWPAEQDGSGGDTCSACQWLFCFVHRSPMQNPPVTWPRGPIS